MEVGEGGQREGVVKAVGKLHGKISRMVGVEVEMEGVKGGSGASMMPRGRDRTTKMRRPGQPKSSGMRVDWPEVGRRGVREQKESEEVGISFFSFRFSIALNFVNFGALAGFKVLFC